MFGPFLSPLWGDVNDGLWFPQDASTFAGEVDSTFNMILWICIAFFIPIVIALAWFAIKYHQPKGGKATSRVRHNNVLEISWSVFPAFVLVIMFVRGSWGYLDQREPPTGAAEVNVQAFKWDWSMDYGNGIVSPELHAVVNQPTRLVMRSTDVIHSLYVPAFRIKRDVVPGRYNVIWFEATVASEKVSQAELDEALKDAEENHGGDFDPERYGFTRQGYTYFDLYCAEYCGRDHSQMQTVVVVHETQEDFEAWLAAANVKPEGMTDEEYGRQLYQTRGCQSCHSIDGTRLVGPSFAGLFGTTHALESGEQVTVDENYVRESILDPRAKIVAGYQAVMPSYKGQLTDEQINSLVAFIKSLNGD
ncbi:cytochrome c oxidase subunit II [Candidatus Laterigemmans baculatus]|uniref:cytochrome c oxidase subunit II n=1 Tax=Candidatus Laterigemmans baculatus TaxID=2770505 RepID=UPI001F43C97D|nr:cytochrome c oxidase subunit II [Candidatus Laterigemmans baculatus]